MESRGNKIDYFGIKYTPNVDITTAKLLLNSVISTKNSKVMGIDLKSFYINMPIARYEYMKNMITMMP